jgi:hypothetical protein
MATDMYKFKTVKVSNQLVSLASREKALTKCLQELHAFSQVSNQLVSLASREVILINLNMSSILNIRSFQSISFPSE